jgi:hypothetical protein
METTWASLRFTRSSRTSLSGIPHPTNSIDVATILSDAVRDFL